MRNKTYIFGRTDAAGEIERIKKEIVKLHEQENITIVLSEDLGCSYATNLEQAKKALITNKCDKCEEIYKIGIELNLPIFGIDANAENATAVKGQHEFLIRELSMAEMIKNLKSVSSSAVIINNIHLHSTSELTKAFLNDPDVEIFKSPNSEELENNIVVVNGPDWNSNVYIGLAKLANSLVREEKEFINTYFRMKAKTKEAVYDRVDFINKNKDFFCYVKDNKIVGILGVTKNSNSVIVFGPAFTIPTERKKGIMTDLFEEAFKVFPRKEYAFAIGVLCKNEKAIRLYEKIGFVSDHITMTLTE